jgi:hypothetical protein
MKRDSIEYEYKVLRYVDYALVKGYYPYAALTLTLRLRFLRFPCFPSTLFPYGWSSPHPCHFILMVSLLLAEVTDP